jgi:hypothetical protein
MLAQMVLNICIDSSMRFNGGSMLRALEATYARMGIVESDTVAELRQVLDLLRLRLGHDTGLFFRGRDGMLRIGPRQLRDALATHGGMRRGITTVSTDGMDEEAFEQASEDDVVDLAAARELHEILDSIHPACRPLLSELSLAIGALESVVGILRHHAHDRTMLAALVYEAGRQQLVGRHGHWSRREVATAFGVSEEGIRSHGQPARQALKAAAAG